MKLDLILRPREAAVEVIRLINHRNTHIAMLALHVSSLSSYSPFAQKLKIDVGNFTTMTIKKAPRYPRQELWLSFPSPNFH
jgi:ADP-ribosylation factor-binding protein GGA